MTFADVIAEMLALVGRPVLVTVAFVGGGPTTLASFSGTLRQSKHVGERCGCEALLLAVSEGSLIVYADVFGGAIREADALVVRQAASMWSWSGCEAALHRRLRPADRSRLVLLALLASPRPCEARHERAAGPFPTPHVRAHGRRVRPLRAVRRVRAPRPARRGGRGRGYGGRGAVRALP